MIANDTWHLGYVTVTVDGDWAQVDYFCSEDLDPDSQWDQVHVYREFFTFFRSTEEVHRLTPRRIESPFTFGKPFRISDYFGDDRVALLYVNNMMAHLSPRTLEICAGMLYTIKGAYAPERRPANETDYCNRAG